jgi:hypothetical protein
MEQVEAEMGSAAEARLNEGAMGRNPANTLFRLNRDLPRGPGNQTLATRDGYSALIPAANKAREIRRAQLTRDEEDKIDKGLVMGTNPMMASKGASRRRRGSRLTRRR